MSVAGTDTFCPLGKDSIIVIIFEQNIQEYYCWHALLLATIIQCHYWQPLNHLWSMTGALPA